MVVFPQSLADIARDTLIERFGTLPTQGYLAGQAVASTLFSQFDMPQGAMRDLDVFCTNNKSADEQSKGLLRQVGETHIDVQQSSFALCGSVEKSIGGYFVTNSVIDNQRPDINYVTVSFKSPIEDEDTAMACLISAFDLNCCQLAYDPVRHRLIGTKAFSDFLESQTLAVTYLATPMHTAVRFLKKCEDMPFLKKDIHRTLSQLQTMIEIVTRNANEKSGYMVNNLFSDVYKARFERFSDTLGRYFRIVPKTVTIHRKCDTFIGLLEQRERVNFYVLEAKDYDSRLINYFSQGAFGQPNGNFESIITLCSPFLLTDDDNLSRKSALEAWLPHFPKAIEPDSQIIRYWIVLLAQQAICPTKNVLQILRIFSKEKDLIGYFSSLTHAERQVLFSNVAYLEQHHLVFLLHHASLAIEDGGKSEIKAKSHNDDYFNYQLPLPHDAAYRTRIDEIVHDSRTDGFCFERNIVRDCIHYALEFNEPDAIYTWITTTLTTPISALSLNIFDPKMNKQTLADIFKYLASKGVSYDVLFEGINRTNEHIQDPDLFTHLLMRVDDPKLLDLDTSKQLRKHFSLDMLTPEHGGAVVLYVMDEFLNNIEHDILTAMKGMPDWMKVYCLKFITGNVDLVRDAEFSDDIPF